MFSGRKSIVLFLSTTILALIWMAHKEDDSQTSPSFDESKIYNNNSLVLPRRKINKKKIQYVNDIVVRQIAPRLKLKAGSGPNEVGVSKENTVIGPGMIKRSGSSYLISDTFNNRILKVDENGEQEMEISFPQDSLLQGFAENQRGEIWSIRRDGAQLFLDKFDSQGRKKESTPVKSSVEEFNNYAGTFRTFFSNGDLYISGFQKVMRVNSDGSTQVVPGIPMETEKGVYLSARQDKKNRYIIDMSTENSKVIKSFYAPGEYQSLKNIFSDNKGQIHVEFEHTFESTQADTGETIISQAAVIETFDSQGKMIKEDMFEKSSDAEIDQDIDIDENGNLDRLVMKDSNFEFYGRMI